MTVLSREQVEKLKKVYTVIAERGKSVFINEMLDCIETIKHLHTQVDLNAVKTIEHLQSESDRKEMAHEKARREVEVELKKTHDQMIGNFNVSVKAISQQAERIRQLEKALNKASQMLQDKGFEEESKAIDCMAEL